MELRKLTRRALALRLLVAVGVHFGVGEFALAPDQATYDYVGDAVARYWSGDALFQTSFVRKGDPVAYYYIVGVLYYILGHWTLLPKLVNCCVGALTVPLVYRIALAISGDPATALRSARYTAYFPSLVLWSALLLRDIWTAWLVLLICHLAMALQDSPRLWRLLVLGGSIYLLTQFRGYILYPILAPIVLSFVVRGRRNVARNLVIGGLIGLAVIYVDSTSGAQRRFRLPDLETLQDLRYFTSLGAQQFEAGADISTPMKAALFLPRGVAFFLLAPFPWEVRNLVQASTVPEMLFFYSLLPFLVVGLRHLVVHRLSDALMTLLIVAALTFGYALGQSNVGTAYRHRAQVLPFYLILAATGVEIRRRRATPAASVAPASPRSLPA